MARINIRQAASMCQRLGTSLNAGLDLRQLLQREARHGRTRYGHQMAQVAERVERGATFAEALKASEDYFPRLVCELVDVGEQTGQLETVLLRLANHYQHLLDLRRMF